MKIRTAHMIQTNKITDKIRVIDSHTAGEPTRIVIEGGPKLRGGTLSEMRDDFAANFDKYRSAIVQEPRGSDVLVGGLLVKSPNPECVTGIIFFNNAGVLGMCGHGTIGLAATLSYLGEIGPGVYKIDTPVGIVTVQLHQNGDVSVENVVSYSYRSEVKVEIPGHGTLFGDIAWGGNWFFLISNHGKTLHIDNAEDLTQFTWQIRLELERQGITGKDGALIDHVELFAPCDPDVANSKNFVMCPGKAYDRSPCGTGTSAKLACLAAHGELLPGQIFRQASILNTVFQGSYQNCNGGIVPTITGQAFVTADSTLILNSADPLCFGITKSIGL